MNKLFIAALFVCSTLVTAYSQDDNEKKFHIGITAGVSVPVGSFASDSSSLAESGVQLNLIDFGYVFSDKFGVAARWYGGANPVDSQWPDLEPWSYGGILIGPLYTNNVGNNLSLDIKPMIGYAVTTHPRDNEQAISLAFSIGTGLRYHLGSRFSLLFNVDYFRTKPNFKGIFGESPVIKTLAITGGAAFRF